MKLLGCGDCKDACPVCYVACKPIKAILSTWNRFGSRQDGNRRAGRVARSVERCYVQQRDGQTPASNPPKDGLNWRHYALFAVVLFIFLVPIDHQPVRSTKTRFLSPMGDKASNDDKDHMIQFQTSDPNPEEEEEEIISDEDLLGPCVCKIDGAIADCHCGVETVDYVNKKYIRPIIQDIVQEDFFKYYRVDLDAECPFWYEDGVCMTRECAVDSCEAKAVPAGILNHKESIVISKDRECFQIQRIDKSLSDKERQKIEGFNTSFCAPELNHGECPHGDFVNLLKNPEGYTGYAGESALKVWEALYNENCFKNTDTPLSVFDLDGEQCLERRVFYRVISGLQASIASHLCHKYPVAHDNWDTEWQPNVGEYFRRFSDETTHGEGALWLKNMYFTYLMVLRAVAKSASIWESYPFYVDGTESDAHTKELVTMLSNAAEVYNKHLFDEHMLSSEQALELRDHFRNVTRIMSCVGCERCKLWGTLQAHGIGTAMEILFLEEGAKK